LFLNRTAWSGARLSSATLFPFGVLLQVGPMDWLGKILAVLGSIGLVFSMLAFVTGILRRR